MVAILFYVKYDKESQMAYKDLMNSEIEFKTFEVRGKNIADRLKSSQITKVPTLLIPSKGQKIEGYLAIKKMIDKVEQYSMRMKRVLRESDSSESEKVKRVPVKEEASEKEESEPEESESSEKEESEPEEIESSEKEESEPEDEDDELEI